MSANKHLEWIELTDFNPGLTTVGGDILEPATGAATMEDCMPSPMGGIIAGMRAVSFSITGIANPTTIGIKGLFTRGGVGFLALNSDRYIFVQDGTDLKMYRWDGAIPATSWALIHTVAAGSTLISGVVSDIFIDAGDVEYVVVGVGVFGGAGEGLYSIQRSTGAVIRRTSNSVSTLVVQDDKIVIAEGATLKWSASQSVSSFPAENNLPIQLSRQGSGIKTMNAFAPSDILIGKNAAPWTLVQGEIEQPLVRGMSDARTPAEIQLAPLTSGGVAFMSKQKGVFLTTDGNQFNHISAQLADETFSSSTNSIGYSTNFLMCAGGGGHIYDERTGSWHTTSAFSAKASLAVGDKKINEIFVASKDGAAALTMWTYNTQLTDLAGDYTWKSVPLRSSDGRQMAIREVQLYVETFDSNSVLTVTVGGITHSLTVANISKEQLSFRFLARAESLDVKVTASAGTPASNQAPSIEVVRIGYTTGHLLTP